MIRSLAFVITLLCLTTVALAKKSNLPVKEYDLGAGSITGDIVRGPRRIVAKNLNVLRYDYQFNSTISFSQPVDLFAKLTSIAAPSPMPPPAAAEAFAAVNAAACEGGTVQDSTALQHICQAVEIRKAIAQRSADIKTLSDRVANNFSALTTTLVPWANCSVAAAKNAGSALTNFLLTTTGDPTQTMAGIAAQLQNGGGMPCGNGANPGADSTFIRGTKAEWPDFASIATLMTDTAAAQAQLDQHTATFSAFLTDQTIAIAAAQRNLQSDSARLAGTDKQAADNELRSLKNAANQLQSAAANLNKATSQNAKITSLLPDLQQSSPKYSDFVTARDLLRTWKARMETLQTRWNAFQNNPVQNSDPFSISAVGDCGFAFSRTKTTALGLTRVDRMPGTTGTNPEAVLSVSVECSSPFTISAGVAFSTLKEREFSIQPVATPPGSTTTTNEFVATTKSNFHPLPLGMIHTRLWEPTEWLSLHGSFGIAGNIRSQNSGGSDAEFLIGPSVSFFRTMFFTPGLHLGREVSLGSNFQENQPVPANITTPPLQKSYKAAFGLAITFTKP